jgi:hypothetical protein
LNIEEEEKERDDVGKKPSFCLETEAAIATDQIRQFDSSPSHQDFTTSRLHLQNLHNHGALNVSLLGQRDPNTKFR